MLADIVVSSMGFDFSKPSRGSATEAIQIPG